MRLASEEHVARAGEALADGRGQAMPALRTLSLETDSSGPTLRFEVNMDQTAGETATAKKVLEAVLAIPAPDQALLAIVREATVLG